MSGLSQRKGGMYYARDYYTKDGKRREKWTSLHTKNLNVAVRRLRMHEAKVEAEKSKDWVASLPFEDVAQAFINQCILETKPNTVLRYKTCVKHLGGMFNGVDFSTIGRGHLSKYETMRRTQGVKPYTVKGELLCLSGMFVFAIRKEWTDNNPVISYVHKSRRFGSVPRRTRYLTHEEEARLLAAARTERWANKEGRTSLHDAIIFAIDTGMRSQEQFDAQWTHLQRGDTNRICIPRTKTDLPRTVPLLDRVANNVTALPVRGPYMFHDAKGNPAGRYIKRAFAKVRKQAGLDDVVWHDLRRTCGCRLLQDYGATMKEVSEWLGHVSIATTERHYAFLRHGELDKFVQRQRERQQGDQQAQVIPLRAKNK